MQLSSIRITALLVAWQDTTQIGIHPKHGQVHPGASQIAEYHDNADAFSIGIDSLTTTFDFELCPPAIVPRIPPDTVPANYPDYSTAIDGGVHFAGQLLPNIVILRFKRGATQSLRQAAVESVCGVVIGGSRYVNGDGHYLVRIPSDGTPGAVFAAIRALKALPEVLIASPEFFLSNPTNRPPLD